MQTAITRVEEQPAFPAYVADKPVQHSFCPGMESRDVAGVRVRPAVLHFMDVIVGRIYQATITVTNISSVSRSIEVRGPEDAEFTLNVTNPDKPVAPGLQVTATVDYQPKVKGDIRDKLVIYVNSQIIEIPVLGFAPSCLLEMDTEVDFGTLIANSKVISKEITIMNHGSSPGAFKIKYSGILPISIVPSSGMVEPKTMQWINVELCTDEPRLVEEIALVKLQGHDDIHFWIKGNVVEQVLEILDVSHKTLQFIDFGAAFFGTSRTRQAVLFNNSPELLDWVAVLEDDVPGVELGTDLQKSTDAFLQNPEFANGYRTQDAASLIFCVPNQGSLLPFQKTTVTLFFSPKQIDDEIMMDGHPPRKDYALFMRFEPAGSTDVFQPPEGTDNRQKKKHRVELALKGTGLPVSVTFNPGPIFDFSDCSMGERTDILSILRNECPSLPVALSFRKIPHFQMFPAKVKIQPGSTEDVILAFAPHQVGTFKVKQIVDIIGPVTEDNSEPLKMKAFHQISLQFSAVCRSAAKKIVMKLNTGITPVVSNPTGHFIRAPPEETAIYAASGRVAMLNSMQTHIHSHQKANEAETHALVAFPNDRSASMRPSDRQKKYRTIFTKVERHTYVDPDYAYTDEEEAQRQAHKDQYAEYIRRLRDGRLQEEATREFQEVNNPVDIGIKPASGLKPPKISVTDIHKDQMKHKPPLSLKGRLLTTRELTAGECTSTASIATDGLNAVPSTTQEKEDCSRTLTPQQLHRIVIGPATIDFGEVCVSSTTVKQMTVLNNLPMYVWIQLEIDSEELQQTSPLSHVVPPLSQIHIPVTYETNEVGDFKKSVTYSINQKPTGHVLITAAAVPVALELSTNDLTLCPSNCLLVETGFRTTITVYNRRNYPAEFSWKPIITEKGIAFSIRPARGTVDAFKDIECEVVWHPGFFSPEEGEFNLTVYHGDTIRLRCTAKFGPTNVQFVEQRLLFNQTPLGLMTTKTAIIQNTGVNHAFYQVLDVYPLQGMSITPAQGVIPVGGVAKLQINFAPNSVIKFDTRVEIAVRNAKNLELRIGGSVVLPEVDISVNSFLFSGVYMNSTQVIPFVLQNKATARARVDFDMAKFEDFALTFADQSGVLYDPEKPYEYSVELDGKSALDCSLLFNPKEVAAYDFNLPVNVNFTGFVSPAPSPVPCLSEKHIVTPRPQMVNVIAPKRRVNATVLQQPLTFSTTNLEFNLPTGFLELGILSEGLATKTLELHNTSKRRVTWKLDLDHAGKSMDAGVFRFSRRSGYLDPGQTIIINICFCPPCQGTFKAEVPVVLNDNPNSHFRPLYLCGNLKSPSLSFDPPLVVLAPVPLDTETMAEVTISPFNFSRDSILHVEIPVLDLENEDGIAPLSVHFPSGSAVAVSSDGTIAGLTCHICFKSPKPLSFIVDLAFVDAENNRFPLQVAGTAENCLLTVYPHLALHRTDEQVILRSGNNGTNGRTNTGEALLRPCYIPSTPSNSTSSSSLGALTLSTYDDSASDGDYDSSYDNGKITNGVALAPKTRNTFAVSFFPEEDSEEKVFYHKVIAAVQMWFSLFGWANGSNPISIPTSLRSGMCKIQMSKSEPKISKPINLGKQTKTVYDMLFYLSGQMLPGITASQSLPADPTERVLQLHWQHTTLLTFLKNQGASLSHIKPEFLLEPDDYKKWIGLQFQLKELQSSSTKIAGTTTEQPLLDLEDSAFESVSKRVWTDLLLQTYKVLVLSRVSAIKIRNDQSSVDVLRGMPRINPDPLSSNIYSPEERALLTWLNVHYEKTRSPVWQNSERGDVPPKRWIVNFERDLLDGLVFATILASYCPFLISSHFVKMYTQPFTPEQCLHNCLILVNAFRAINLDIDIQATDICDPNPVLMLMLCVYLFEKMPLYVPKKTVVFDGALHSTVARELRLKNPSSKPLVYNATIAGSESADFSLPKGDAVMIAPKSQMILSLEFSCRFLHPSEATLLLISSPVNGAGGSTMAFSLKSQINNIGSTEATKYESPCYELNEISLLIRSPFGMDGEFRIILVESTSPLTFPTHLQHISKIKQEKSSSAFIYEADVPTKVTNEMSQAGSSDVDTLQNSADRSNPLREFFCTVKSLHLDRGLSSLLKVDFLPFDMKKRYCTIILTNEQIGDFVCLVEATGGPPLPSALLPVNSPNVLHVSNAVEDQNAAALTMYFKCRQEGVLVEDLRIPQVNEAREKALAIAAQKQMSTVEYERRKVTGTLESSSLRAAVAAAGLSKLQTPGTSTLCKTLQSIDYSVEVSMPQHFEVPKQLSMPVSAGGRIGSNQDTKEGRPAMESAKDDEVKLRVRFVPKEPGRYPCQIILRSTHDIRVYAIECVVNAKSAAAELEFITPAHQSLVQDIPICNMTQQDWKLEAALEGDWFYGPPSMYVKAGETSEYSLMFKPISKSVTKGRLILRNHTDGTEHIFNLKGVGQNAQALEHVVMDCQVNRVTHKVLMVPNFTNGMLTYKVSSDLPMVVGPPTLTVNPGLYAPYEISVSPWKRGVFTGIISFVVEGGEQRSPQYNMALEETDGKPSAETTPGLHAASSGVQSLSHEVWFSLKVKSKAAEPENTLSVSCAVLESVGLEIPITNPTHEALYLNVLVKGTGLAGNSNFVLRPKETLCYVVTYSPISTGISEGSVIFQSDVFGEFWYALQLSAKRPAPITLPEIRCELGKWTRLNIPLRNPTHEPLELEAVNSNTGHFSVEVDPKKPVMVPPHSTMDVPVQFCPSALGRANHRTFVFFKSEKIDEWTFHISGIGLIPQPMEPASISTCVNCLSSVIISFKNPTDEHVLIDVLLSDQEQTMHRLSASVLRHSISTESAFCLPLKQTQGIPLAPKEKFDIPVLFTPDIMKLYEALVVVHMVKQNGGTWPCDNIEELDLELKSISRADNGEISGIRWIYPIHGIPEAAPSKSAPAIVSCQARSRAEERIEVLLTGAVPGQAGMATVRNGAITPQKKLSTGGVQDELQVTEGFATTEEFLYELQYESDQVKSQLETSLAIGLVRKERDGQTGIVTLIFNIIFSPSKPMKHTVTLVVQCVTGGIWKFPIKLIATEPNVDDVINIEAIGLNKESIVGFRLTSQSRYPEPFTAYFLPGSDKAFAVLPQTGELLPLGTAGTLITVGFTPAMYSKRHTATLMIQTAAMQWTYEINGMPPQTTPPKSASSKIASAGYIRSATVRQRNFLRENIKLVATAVSSPIKGAPLVLRMK
ncbi:cilia- and flagella-associated protein 47 [Ambystoma mexicanum]|uniref:cilia- and flagella-associated protein 47 n=1 Tax=Ambystoma mexicanum TaxID=8296 RepID=UPI0037E99490